MWRTPNTTVMPPPKYSSMTAEAILIKTASPAMGRARLKLFLESVQLTPQRPKKTQSTKKRAVWRKALSQYRSAKAAALSSTDVPRISFTMGITPQIQNMKWSKIIKRTQSPLKKSSSQNRSTPR